jgi:MFS transporter, UMF1 family
MTGEMAAAATEFAESPPRRQSAKLGRAGWVWVLFDSARIPQILLIGGFVFAPYFVTVIVGDPVKGQGLIALIGTILGLTTAIFAPLVGASVDKYGRRKPLLAACVFAIAGLLACLWWAKPGRSGLGTLGPLLILGVAGALGGVADLLFVSLMHLAVGRERAAKASGLALAIANFVAVATLVAVLWCFELPGRAHLPLLPSHPLFGLSHAAYEPERIVGPIAGAIWIIFATPFLLFGRDGARTGRTIVASAREGLSSLWSLVRSARTLNRDIAWFIAGRVPYADATGCYIAFSGVFAAGVMGWRGPQILLFGIVLAAFCMFGGILAQLLDRAIGPRRALIAEIIALSGFMLAQIGTDHSHILFLALQPRTVATIPDLFFGSVGVLAGMCVAAMGASSRTLLVRLAPEGQLGAIYGLASLTGSTTGWIGPLLIGLFTAFFHSQAAGFVPLLAMLIASIFVLKNVRGGNRWRPGVDAEVAR